MENEQLMTIEESYVERRQLFKDIWDTAMHMDEKDGEILNKPKVIKTLRLSDVDRSAGRKKKQRIKNLRAVCRKILEFCDKQDADDIFYEQIAAEGHIAPLQKHETRTKRRKLKTRKKVKRSKSLFTATKKAADPQTTVSGRKDDLAVDFKNKSSRNTSPIKYTRHMIVKRPTTMLPKLGSTVPSLTQPIFPTLIKPITPSLNKPIVPSPNKPIVSSFNKAIVSSLNKPGVDHEKPSQIPSRKIAKKKSIPKKKKLSRDFVTTPLKIDVLE